MQAAIKHMREGGVTPEDWLLYVISLLCHDIGFVRGVCRADRRDMNTFATTALALAMDRRADLQRRGAVERGPSRRR